MKRLSVLVLAVLVVMSISGSTSLADTVSFQGLGDLAGGNFESQAYAISGNGKVVVGSSSSATSNGEQAFIWTIESGMQGLDYLVGSKKTTAKDVSYDGSTVVGWSGYLEANPEAFKWTELDGISSLGSGRAHAISNDGSVVVGDSHGTGITSAKRWTELDGEVLLGGRAAYGISANGAVAVGVIGYSTEMEAVFWNESGNMISLDLGGTTESAKAASADGTVIVGSGKYEGKRQVFRWTLGVGWHLIDNLTNGEQGYATDVSSDGSIIVGYNYTLDGGSDPFIWDENNGTRNFQDLLQNDFGLNLTGWDLERITGMAADNGTFVGYGINPDGYREAWIAFTPITPNTAPVANAGPDQIVFATGGGIAQVTLDGSGSSDPDGDELTYEWTWSIGGDTYNATGVNPTIELPVGEHIIQLIVNDGTIDSEPDYVEITVLNAALSGWVWMEGSTGFGYSLEEGDLVYFVSFGPILEYNITTGQWVDYEPSGWIYIDWPFFYDLNKNSLMFALPPESGLSVYHFSTGQWEILPRIIPGS